jgi:hypothetical protein
MGFGRLQDPAAMGRLVSSEGVGPLSLEKRASTFESGINHILKGLHFAYQHPRASGAIVGAAVGAALAPKGEDKKETARNTVGSLLGGALGGVMVGDVMEKTKGDPRHLKFTVRTLAFGARNAPAAGRALINAFTPEPAPPEALVDILGKKNRYSDVDLVKKYNDEKPTGDREKKFVGALRSLYTEADHAKSPPNTKAILKQQARNIAETVAPIGMSMFMGESLPNALIQAAPAIVRAVAGTAKTVKETLSPAVTVSDKRDAKTRASFNDAQLRRLLRGLRVEQVQEHVIK